MNIEKFSLGVFKENSNKISVSEKLSNNNISLNNIIYKEIKL